MSDCLLETQPGCLWFLGLHPNVSIFFSVKDFIYLLKILSPYAPKEALVNNCSHLPTES